jgi:prepilin-type N-terminal cleavage/methylation domain-containing protein
VRRRAGDAGYTLVEMLVVLAIAGLLAGAVGELLVQSNRVIVTVGAELRSPLVQPALARIRADLESASAPPEGSDEWIAGPLEFHTLQGEHLRYELVDRALIREELDPGGRTLRARTVVQGISVWKWMSLAPRLVGVRLVWPGVPGLWDEPTWGGRRRPVGWRGETMWVARRAARGSIP